jgi:hypothetical protein
LKLKKREVLHYLINGNIHLRVWKSSLKTVR